MVYKKGAIHVQDYDTLPAMTRSKMTEITTAWLAAEVCVIIKVAHVYEGWVRITTSCSREASVKVGLYRRSVAFVGVTPAQTSGVYPAKPITDCLR